MTIATGPVPRRGLGIAAFILGVVAFLGVVFLFVVARLSHGLSDIAIAAILGYWVAVPVGLAAVVLGVIGVIRKSAKVLSWIGLILGLAPLLWMLALMLGLQIPGIDS